MSRVRSPSTACSARASIRSFSRVDVPCALMASISAGDVPELCRAPVMTRSIISSAGLVTCDESTARPHPAMTAWQVSTPRRAACSAVSRTSAPADSLMTIPVRRRSNGIEDCSGLPFHRDSAISWAYWESTYCVHREVEAETTASSTTPRRSIRDASAMARRPLAHVASSLTETTGAPNCWDISRGNDETSTPSDRSARCDDCRRR